MQTRFTRKLAFGGLGLIALACLWLYFAPVGLGGSTSYVVTDGISMEPRFHTGDLALVRGQSSYHVGEIVAYRSRAFHTIVLHRIVGRAGARYVFKGDNNNFVDFEHPTRSQLVGSLWLHIPGVGSRLESLRSPALTAALIGVAVLLFSGAAFGHRRRRRRRERRATDTGQPPPRHRPLRSAEPLTGVLAIALVGLLPFVGLAVLAFTRPNAARLPFSVPYRQSGTLSYSADAVPGPIYPHDRAVTGDPLFTHVVGALRLRFGYRFAAAAANTLAGRASLSATMTSTSGWRTTFPLGRPTYFRGDRAALSASLDLTSLLALLRRVEASTAVRGSYTLTLIPRVSATGSLGGVPLATAFTPKIQFAVNQLEIQSVTPGGGSGEAGRSASSLFSPSMRGAATGRRYQPLFLSFAVARTSVETARWIALGGIATVLCALLAMVGLARPRRRDEAAAILARYGRLVVPVERVWQLPGAAVIDVAEIDALVQIAERYDRAILYEDDAEAGAFWVVDESGQFRYALRAPEWTADATQPALEIVAADSVEEGEWSAYDEPYEAAPAHGGWQETWEAPDVSQPSIAAFMPYQGA